MRFSKKFKTNTALELGTVQVYTISVDRERKNISEYQSYLSADEREKARRFKFQADQERFIIGRAILRILSGFYLEKDPRQLCFDYGEYGKPDFAAKELLKFNLSHSGKIIVLGFALKDELGIDVELIKTDYDVLKLAHNFFSIHEIKSLNKLPINELPHGFFRCWTRKESFIKANGSGLSFPLDEFAVSLDDDFQAELVRTEWDASERSKWNLFSFVPSEQYIGALAVRNKLSRVRYFDWDGMYTQQTYFK